MPPPADEGEDDGGEDLDFGVLDDEERMRAALAKKSPKKKPAAAVLKKPAAGGKAKKPSKDTTTLKGAKPAPPALGAKMPVILWGAGKIYILPEQKMFRVKKAFDGAINYTCLHHQHHLKYYQ